MAVPRPCTSVCFADVDGEGVLLDVRTNRYVGLTPISARIWQAALRHASLDDIAVEVGPPASAALVEVQLSQWRDANLCEDSTRGRASTPRLRPSPSAARRDLVLDDRVSASIRTTVRYVARVASTRRRLKTAGLCATLVDYQARNPTAHRRDAGPELHEIIRSYVVARIPFAQGDADCMPRSIALASLLRERRFDATLCVGVQKAPFRAHAWVELHDLVVNDALERIRPFHVIARY